ncbi:MAG: HAMP domain-containing sensor histidine kinase [Anaerolineaceae bacterium]
MFRSLRARLILSHVLPLVIILPLLGLGLVYLLEHNFLLPELAQNLLGDARLLGEISRSEYEIAQNPLLFQRMISRVKLDPDVKVMFLSSTGRLLFSSESADIELLGTQVDAPGLAEARQGNEIALTNYSLFRLENVVLDVYSPVLNPLDQVIGIVRLTYHVASVYDLFIRFRYLIGIVLLLGLALSLIIGSLFGVSIARPVHQVTDAIYDLASGKRTEALEENGPVELRKQTRAVNYLVHQLHTADQARSQLLANLVHELGQPLGALKSAIQAFSRGAGDDPELARDLTHGMHEEVTHLQHLLDDLARLYDKELGPLELNRTAVNLSSWLPEILLPWKSAAAEKELAWSSQIAADTPLIYADTMRLTQIVGNLASNAIRYTPRGGSITVTCGADGKRVFIRFADTGMGIAPAEQEKIFNPFYQGDQGRRIKQGMGLGLGIARDLAEAHGGSIHLESEPGRGSIFTVWLPLPEETPA